MKWFHYVAVALVFALVVVFAVVGFSEEKKGGLTFEDFSIVPGFNGEPAAVDFSSYPDAEKFKTRISEGAKEGPNFAGRYTVITWGCGTSCQSSAIVDAHTGDIVVYGILSSFGLAYRLDSALFIVNPKENLPEEDLINAEEFSEEHYPLGAIPLASDYYALFNEELIFVGRYSAITGGERTCPSSIVEARNPITLETRTFSGACLVPFGWDALES